MKLDAALATQIANEIATSGVRLTSDQVQELLEGRYSLIGTIMEWGTDDTEVRGLLLNLLSDALVGESWPTFGETHSGRDFEAFMGRLWTAARAKGFEVVAELT